MAALVLTTGHIGAILSQCRVKDPAAQTSCRLASIHLKGFAPFAARLAAHGTR
jgi:hypothetical protein